MRRDTPVHLRWALPPAKVFVLPGYNAPRFRTGCASQGKRWSGQFKSRGWNGRPRACNRPANNRGSRSKCKRVNVEPVQPVELLAPIRKAKPKLCDFVVPARGPAGECVNVLSHVAIGRFARRASRRFPRRGTWQSPFRTPPLARCRQSRLWDVPAHLQEQSNYDQDGSGEGVRMPSNALAGRREANDIRPSTHHHASRRASGTLVLPGRVRRTSNALAASREARRRGRHVVM